MARATRSRKALGVATQAVPPPDELDLQLAMEGHSEADKQPEILEVNEEADKEINEVQDLPVKRTKTRKRAPATSSAEDLPAKKRRLPPSPGKEVVAQPSRSPLPQRRGRNDDPTGKRAKKAKGAARKATKAAKAEDIRKKAEAENAAKEMLAEMEVDESFAQRSDRQHRIRRFSDLDPMPARVDNDSSEGESFALDNISGTDSDELEPKGNAKCLPLKPVRADPRKPPGKAAKLRDQVAARKNVVRNKKGVEDEAGGKELLVASGFNPNWLAASKQKTQGKQAAMGGLDDDAAISTRPNFHPSPNKFDRETADAKIAKASQRNYSRKNLLVVPDVEDSDDLDSAFPLIPAKNNRKNTKPLVIPPRSRKKQSQQSSMTTDKRRVKKPPRQASVSSTTESTTMTDSSSRMALMPKGTARLNTLPSIILSSSKTYFSTLFSALFASEQPFDHFKKNSTTFLTISRVAFKHVWPDLNIQLEVDDVLFNLGYQRVLEKRGRIHDAVKADLDHHFASEEFSTIEITHWVEWFRSTYGSPIFYETPVPEDGVWDSRDPEYQKPRGFLKSSFLIRLGSRFLQDSETTAFDFGPPRGLFVLLLTACEKVARSFKSGSYVSSGDFDAKACNTWVKQYNKNFDNKDAAWWEKILQFYNNGVEESDGEGGCISMLDEGRAALLMSSP